MEGLTPSSLVLISLPRPLPRFIFVSIAFPHKSNSLPHRSIDPILHLIVTLHLCATRDLDILRTMSTTSKFVEILDTANLPYSHDNVSLDDVLDDVRHRTSSTGSISSNETSPTRETNQARPDNHNSTQSKTRLRGFSLKVNGKT